MVRTCAQSLNKITQILHTLVVWSNVFYLFAAIMAFMSGYNILGIIMILITAISTLYHINSNMFGISNKIWSVLDVTTATGGSIAILIYGIIFMFKNRGMDIFYTRRTFMIGFIFVILMAFSLLIFIVARLGVGKITPDDPNKGLFGPLIGATPDEIDEKCYTTSRQAEYLIYHTIWHLLGGVVGIIFMILITTK